MEEQNGGAPPTGLDQDRLTHLCKVVREDIARGRYFGAVVLVARHGRPGLLEAFGHAHDGGEQPLAEDTVFSLFSLTKALTNVLALRAVEFGQFALTTRVSSVIPEFGGGARERITFFHLLTHTSGLPPVWIPEPGMCIDRLDEVIAAICRRIHCVEEPGSRVHYSPLVNHALIGEALRRCDPKKRGFRQLVEEELFRPLGMRDSAIGLRADLAPRHAFPDFRGKPPQEHLGHSGHGPQGAFKEEQAEMPWVGAVSTVPDLFRFAEMLRRGGELEGARILSPAALALATRNWTGEQPNEMDRALALKQGWEPWPACLGLGFGLRGEALGPSLFGSLASPRTFGNSGAGSTLFWVDPERQLSFVFLSAGVLRAAENIERFQRLSDIASSAAL